MGRAVYKRGRPDITVECTGGKNLGNCYNATFYKVTSVKQLSKEQIEGLRDLGLLGSGQEFFIRSKCDGVEEPAGFDTIPCVDEETGEQAYNPYSEDRAPYPAQEEPYYEYDIERRIDSGD